MTRAQAVGMHRLGGPEVLEVLEVDVPEPGPGEVRVRVAGAPVNPVDILFRTGATTGDLNAVPPPWVPGWELAGTVDASGEGAPFAAGDRVMAMTTPYRRHGGAQAGLVLLPVEEVVAVPDALDLEEASTLPMNGMTARWALDHLALAPGDVLVVTGAAGVVGGYALQLGKLAGLRVVADAGPRDAELVAGLGADAVVPRGEGFLAAAREAAGGRVTGVVDAGVIGAPLLELVGRGGGIAAMRLPDYAAEGVSVRMVYAQQYRTNLVALAELAAHAAAGRVRPRVAGTCPPSGAPEAHSRLAAGGQRGRTVVTFG